MDEPKENQPGFVYSPVDRAKPKQEATITKEDIQPEVEEPLVGADEPLFNWTAPDSLLVDKKKKFSWYLTLIVTTIVISGALYFLTKDTITTVVILVCGILFGIYAAKKPRTIDYQLTKYGFTVNGHYHKFGEYKSFSIVTHGNAGSVVLTPLKRFLPYMYIYFDQSMEQQIDSTLADILPKVAIHKDPLDNFFRKMGF